MFPARSAEQGPHKGGGSQRMSDSIATFSDLWGPLYAVLRNLNFTTLLTYLIPEQKMYVRAPQFYRTRPNGGRVTSGDEGGQYVAALLGEKVYEPTNQAIYYFSLSDL